MSRAFTCTRISGQKAANGRRKSILHTSSTPDQQTQRRPQTTGNTVKEVLQTLLPSLKCLKMNEEPASKRRRFDDSIISSSRASVDALPDVVLQHCFSFIGSGQYRFVAGTCHNFQNIYSIDHQKQTTWRAAASSISGAKLCLEDAKKLGRDVYAILFTLSLEASKTGNIHVLEWARVQHSSYDAGPRHFQQAASFGHVGVFEWADEKGVGGWKSNIMTTINCAIDHERINILEWFWSDDFCRRV